MAFRRDPFHFYPLGRFFDDDYDRHFFDAFTRSMFDDFPFDTRPRQLTSSAEKPTQQPAQNDQAVAPAVDKAGSVAENNARPSSSALWKRYLGGFGELTPLMSTDLVEGESDYSVHVDLPGVAPEDISVSIADRCLTISAERKAAHEEKTDKVHSTEKHYGKVQRKIRLPTNADLDNGQTKFKQGVLTISFPKKAAESNVRRLEVTAEN